LFSIEINSISGFRGGSIESAIILHSRSSSSSGLSTPKILFVLSCILTISIPPAVFAKAVRVFVILADEDRSL